MRHGTFAHRDAAAAAVADMGFDVVYLPPIHPIGRVNRKGPQQHPGRRAARTSARRGRSAPAEGGHDAIHPDLGTLEDFRAFVVAAHEPGVEIAMDLALQCAPDHPWVSEHPEWFTTRADGTIAYAENPPKKYQDIYPLNFDNDPRGHPRRDAPGGAALGGAGREDLPGRQPAHQAARVLALADRRGQDGRPRRAVPGRGVHPAGDDARARQARLHPVVHVLHLAGAGVGAAGVRAGADRGRPTTCGPNFWPNTPDILPEHLQHGGPAMFKIRAVLASLLSPVLGHVRRLRAVRAPAPARAPRSTSTTRNTSCARATGRPPRPPGESLAPYLHRLNRIRRDNPALHWLRNLRFHGVDNEQVLCFSKRDPDSDNTVLVVVSLDSYNVQWGNTTLDMPALGFDWHERFTVRDELTGATFDWGQHNAVRLDPLYEPAHVFTVHRHR